MDLPKLLMTLIQILFIAGLGLCLAALLWRRHRLWAIFLLSLFSVYIFQPLVPLRNFNYWLPTASIVLTVLTWLVLRTGDDAVGRESVLAGTAALSVIVIVALIRFIPIQIPWFPSTAPPFTHILIGLMTVFLFVVAFLLFPKGRSLGRWFMLILLLFVFIILKTEPTALWLSERIRSLQGQSVALVSTLDLSWLGFSYISFRLIHTLRDRQSGRLPSTNLREFATYVLFFPALVAGPIDRIERFIADLDENERLTAERVVQGGRRILAGLFKKFVLADGLAVLALSPTSAEAATSTGWTWVLLYAYAFRLYLDFSGYTDIAIGIGLLTDVKLPENFDRPYQKVNMTAFWNSWHITLARWFRAYYFNPLTRWLRSGPLRNSPGLIVLVGQLSTMVLIGLWHGITWNFAIWGFWHGIGLFIHNRWVDYLRSNPKPAVIDRFPDTLSKALSVTLTFNFIALGWVWFVLPDVGLSIEVLRLLFGLAG